MRLAIVLSLLLAGLPSAALAGDIGPANDAPAVDVGIEQAARRAADGNWDYLLGGTAIVPDVNLSTRLRLALRLSDGGRVERASARWGMWLNDGPEALRWTGRLDRSWGDRVAITFAGGFRLDALTERLGLAHAPWVEMGVQASTAGAQAAPGGTRWSSSVVVAVHFDLAETGLDRVGRPSTGLRFRASASFASDPNCGLSAPLLLLSGRCLTLALALEF
jgi:hypothetical protein